MGQEDGGTVVNPFTHEKVAWKPIGPVVDEFLFYSRSKLDAYTCKGVIGNKDHLEARPAGDHTPWSTHSVVVDGRTVKPLRGWVYAIDGDLPDKAGFEEWLLRELRNGGYPHVKYFNILNRHWNRKSRARGVPFAKSRHSDDDHLHLSFMPGCERSNSSILADWERHRTGQVHRPRDRRRPNVVRHVL